jgi:hypothetical protein
MKPWRERLNETPFERAVELVQAHHLPITTEACPHCGAGGHDADTAFCKLCGPGL